MERITISIPSDTKNALAELAATEDRTIADVVRRLLADAVERAQRQKIYEEIAASMTPEMEVEMVRLCEELEAMRGEEG